MLLKTAWANMDMMNWNNEHDEFDAAAIEGAVDYPQQEETHEEDGWLIDENQHCQNLLAENRGAALTTPTPTGLLT